MELSICYFCAFQESIAYLPLIMSISATLSSMFSKKLVQKIGSKVLVGNEDKRISELTVQSPTLYYYHFVVPCGPRCRLNWRILADENVFCPIELNQWKVHRVGVRSSSSSLARRSTLSVARQRELHNWKLDDSQVLKDKPDGTNTSRPTTSQFRIVCEKGDDIISGKK